MGAPLFLPRRGASIQPQQVPRLDRTHPLAVGLIAGVLPAQRVDFVTGRQYTQGGVGATSAGSAGLGLSTDGSAAYIAAPIPQIVLSQWTVFAVVRANAPNTDARAVSLASSTDTTPYIQIGTATGDFRLVRVLAQANGGTLPANQSSVGFGFDNTLHTVALTYDGINVRCYIDGVLDTTAATSTGAAWTVNQFAVGAHVRTSASAFWRGASFLALAHKRALSGDEIKSLTANPWQLFAAPQRVLPLAGGVTPPPADITGTFAAALSGAVMSATGTLTYSGTMSSGTANAALTVSGAISYSASMSASTAAAAMNAAGGIGYAAGLGANTADAGMTVSGTQTFIGAFAASTTAAMSMTGSVIHNITGTISATTDNAVMNLTAPNLNLIGAFGMTRHRAIR